jgi:hypothetical protein
MGHTTSARKKNVVQKPNNHSRIGGNIIGGDLEGSSCGNCRRQADRWWITRGSRNLDTVPFWTLWRIRASVVPKGMIPHTCAFPPDKFHRRLIVKEAKAKAHPGLQRREQWRLAVEEAKAHPGLW